jgi:hypothetical protein
VALVSSLGCAGPTGTSNDAGGSEGSGGPLAATGSTASTSTVDGAASTLGEATALGDGSDGAGPPCDDHACDADQYCLWPWAECGDPGTSWAECTPRPARCEPGDGPVCGCDGNLYADRCTANMAGVDVDRDHACVLPPGTARCAYTSCDPATEQCVRFNPHIDTDTLYVECAPLPTGCATCDCLELGSDCLDCNVSSEGLVIVECF